MKMVIDIVAELYDNIKDGVNDIRTAWDVYGAIKNGTPLTEYQLTQFRDGYKKGYSMVES